MSLEKVPDTVGSPNYGAAVILAEQIRAKPHSSLQIDRFCCDHSIEYRSFLRSFRRLSGTTPLRFLQSYRIDRAKRLIAGSDNSITDICFELGYESLGTFTRTFTALVGMSPIAFRRLSAKVRGWDMGWFLKELQDSVPTTGGGIPGLVLAPRGKALISFVGMFNGAIPTNGLQSGAVVVGQGRFDLRFRSFDADPVYLLAAGFEADATPFDVLLPSLDHVLVGSATLRRENVSCPKPIRIHLRTMNVLDPAIVYAFHGLVNWRSVGPASAG